MTQSAAASPRTPTARRPSTSAAAAHTTPYTPAVDDATKVEKLQRSLARAKEKIANLHSEVNGLESALVQRTVDQTSVGSREVRAAEHARMEHLLDSQDTVRRLQAELACEREAAAQAAAAQAMDVQRRLSEQAAANVKTAEQAVESVRAQIEDRLLVYYANDNKNWSKNNDTRHQKLSSSDTPTPETHKTQSGQCQSTTRRKWCGC